MGTQDPYEVTKMNPPLTTVVSDGPQQRVDVQASPSLLSVCGGRFVRCVRP